MLAYLDRRNYLGMYNRRFLEHKMAEYIKDVVSQKDIKDEYFHGLASVNFDLNGLKALNDLAGHTAGNKGLKAFANILNHGETTIWLRDELGLSVFTAAEGGDEFGLIAYGTKDLRPYAGEVKKRYGEEVLSYDASNFIDFSDPKVRETLSLMHIDDIVPPDFKFRLSTSVGMSLLSEAFMVVPVTESGKKYHEVVQELINKMFQIADIRGTDNKKEIKDRLGKEEPALSALYSRLSQDVAYLESRIRDLED